MHTAAASVFADLARPLGLDADAQDRLATAWRYSLRAVRRVSEYEIKMVLHGVAYARSSDAWDCAA